MFLGGLACGLCECVEVERRWTGLECAAWVGRTSRQNLSHFPAICENSTLERDRLVEVLMPTVSRQIPEYFEVFAGAAFF